MDHHVAGVSLHRPCPSTPMALLHFDALERKGAEHSPSHCNFGRLVSVGRTKEVEQSGKAQR
jgi:hypothetical protein